MRKLKAWVLPVAMTVAAVACISYIATRPTYAPQSRTVRVLAIYPEVRYINEAYLIARASDENQTLCSLRFSGSHYEPFFVGEVMDVTYVPDNPNVCIGTLKTHKEIGPNH